MGATLWGPTLPAGGRAVTVWLEADLGVVDEQFQPNAVGIGTVGSLQVQGGPTWTDLSDRIVSIKIDAGFERSTQNFTGWKLEATLRNDDGHLSRHNSASPYRLAGIGSTIRTGAPIRVRARYDDGATQRDFTLFVGDVEAWNPAYDAGGYDATIKVSAVDGFARLADFDGFEQTLQGAGETTGARIRRILNNAGHRGSRSIATGAHTVQATNLASNALTEAKLTADSEGGPLWSTPDGTIVFQDRDSLATNTSAIDVQVTFADDGTPALHYLADGVEPRYDDRLLITDAAYARVGGTTQVATSKRARARARRIIQEKRTDLVCETDAQALKLARRAVGLRHEVRERVDNISFDPDAQFAPAGAVDTELQTAAWDAITSGRLSMLSLVRLIYTPVSGPGIDPFDDLEHIRGITHTITPVAWLVDLEFSSAAVWVAASRSRVGVGVVGELTVWS